MQSDTILGKVVIGFIAGAVAVLLFHQVMVLILYMLGQIPNAPYSFRPNAFGVPQIINGPFWGGVWGIFFAFVIGFLPREWPVWVKGIVLGLGLHVILGNWLVLALLRGQPVMAGFAPPRMLIGALIGTAFGMGWVILHHFARARLVRAPA